jgi:hypothetical protein
MELILYALRVTAGAEVVVATLTGRGGRLVIAAVAGLLSLAVPESMDPVMAVIEFLIVRRIG